MSTTYTVVYVCDNVVRGNEPLGNEFEFDGEPSQRMLDVMVGEEGIMDAGSVILTSVEKRRSGWFLNFEAVDDDGYEFDGRFAVALKADVDRLGKDEFDLDALFGE
jgi:hypothetical protein